MRGKQTWVRRSSAGARGSRPGCWHLLADDGQAWCGASLQLTASTARQSWSRPAGTACRVCLRAERAAVRAAAKEERIRARAARPARWLRPLAR